MSPFGRVSASLLLTLVVWSPTAIGSLQESSVDATSAALRFLIIFTLARLAMRGIDRMLRVYKEANGPAVPRGAEPVEAAPVPEDSAETIALNRRRSDGLDDPLPDPFDIGASSADPAFDEPEPRARPGEVIDADASTGALVPSRVDE